MLDRFSRRIIAALSQVNGSAIGSINSETAVTLTGGKKNPLQGRVTKRMEGGNVMFFTNSNSNAYNSMVKRRLAAEGKDPESFQLSPRVWGERIKDTPFVGHKGQLYIEVIFLKSPTDVKYYVDGVETPKSDIQGLPKSAESEQGGLEDKVVLRTYKLDSIKAIKMGALSVLPT